LNFKVSSDGVFLLMIAAAKGFVDIIELMYSNSNLDVSKTDQNGVTAFLIAAWYNRLEALRKLMSMGCDLLATNQNGSNALHIAVK
jgi:ankyrin repeat protein